MFEVDWAVPSGELGLPVRALSQRRSGLRPPLVELHRRILGRFGSVGPPVPLDVVQAEAASLGLDPVEAIDVLASLDLVHIDHSARMVSVAYPYSGIPTSHVVILNGGVRVYAMCAIDALGIPAMLAVPTKIESVDPRTGETVRVDVAGAEVRCRPDTTVVGVAAAASVSSCGPASQGVCPRVNFHTSKRSAESHWAGGLRGVALNPTQALRVAAAAFGRLLDR